MPLEKQIWDVLESQFFTVTPESTLKDASLILKEAFKKAPKTNGLVVMRSNGELIGVLTVADVLTRMKYLFDDACREGGKGDWRAVFLNKCEDGTLLTVNDVLTRMGTGIRPHDSLAQAIQAMTEAEVTFLPVVDAGKVIGIITLQDILNEVASKLSQ
jgi:CBS domain-containing protein